MNASTSSASAKTKQVTDDDALEAVRAGLSRLDGERAVAYGDLTVFRTATTGMLSRHEALLAIKLGLEAPRTVAAREQQAVIAGQIQELKIAEVVASTPLPQVEPAGYVLHGFIRGTGLQPVAHASLALYTIDGKRRDDFATANSDAAGYFILSTPQLSTAARGPNEEASPDPPFAELELRVFAVPRSTQIAALKINAVSGQVDYREILAATKERAAAPSPATVSATPPSTTVASTAHADLKALSKALRERPRASETVREKRPTSIKAEPQVKADTKKSRK